MGATRLLPLGDNALLGSGQTISSVMKLQLAALAARGSDPNASNKRNQRNGANQVTLRFKDWQFQVHCERDWKFPSPPVVEQESKPS
jgi:hypothetical protein